MSAYKFRNNVTNAIVDWDDVFSAEATATMPGALAAVGINVGTAFTPTGRLTLTSGSPILNATVSGASTIYYTPHIGDNICIYNGTQWNNHIFSEASQTLADTTLSPAATVQDTMYDIFGWMNSGTFVATRGPAWNANSSGTAIVSVNNPAVVTWNGHPLHEGSPVVFSGAGLPSSVVAGTTYYVGQSPGANTFNICTSIANVVAGTNISTAAQSSTGTQTVTNGDTLRGTGAGTTQLTRLNGILVNTNAITNGPTVNQGVYLGSIRTNPVNTVDFIYGAEGIAGVYYLWNLYNRVPLLAVTNDATATWTYAVATWRAANANALIRHSFIVGLQEDSIQSIYAQTANGSVAGSIGRIAVGFNITTGTMAAGTSIPSNNGTTAAGLSAQLAALPSLGWNFITACEWQIGTGNTSFYGDSGRGTSLPLASNISLISRY